MSRTPPTSPVDPRVAGMPIAAPPPIGDGPIGEGVACVTCGYSLLGLHPEGVCPECGTPCEHALRGNFLVYAGEGYLSSLKLGVSLILNATLLQVVMLIVTVAVSATVGAGPTLSLVIFVLTGLGMAISGMSLYGWWRFSEPDPGYSGRLTGADARLVVRAMTIALAAISLASFALESLGQLGALSSAGRAGTIAMLGVQLLSFAAGVVQFFAAMRYLRWLAPRLPNRTVYVRSKRYMWLLPLITIVGALVMMIGPLIALVMYWNLLDLVRKDLKRIAAERAGASPA